jgi:hypothetical protein
MICLSYYAYVLSSTKSVIRAEWTCLKLRAGGRVGKEAGWRNDPNNVYTCE